MMLFLVFRMYQSILVLRSRIPADPVSFGLELGRLWIAERRYDFAELVLAFCPFDSDSLRIPTINSSFSLEPLNRHTPVNPGQ